MDKVILHTAFDSSVIVTSIFIIVAGPNNPLSCPCTSPRTDTRIRMMRQMAAQIRSTDMYINSIHNHLDHF